MSDPIDDGGPAFPCPVGHIECKHPKGMSLRDYFAAHCPMSFPEYIAGYVHDKNTLEQVMRHFTEFRLRYADFMLKARKL